MRKPVRKKHDQAIKIYLGKTIDLTNSKNKPENQ